MPAELELRDHLGFGAIGTYPVMSQDVEVDIQQGPEFGTGWSSACALHNYCWTFAKELNEGQSTYPEFGETIRNSFEITNYGTADLTVDAASLSGPYQLVSPMPITVPAMQIGSGVWRNAVIGPRRRAALR